MWHLSVTELMKPTLESYFASPGGILTYLFSGQGLSGPLQLFLKKHPRSVIFLPIYGVEWNVSFPRGVFSPARKCNEFANDSVLVSSGIQKNKHINYDQFSELSNGVSKHQNILGGGGTYPEGTCPEENKFARNPCIWLGWVATPSCRCKS